MSPVDETRVLFVGDMHLGRWPSGLPLGLNADTGPPQAWDNVVQAAVRYQVHCVALAGDLVDQGNDLFEAFGLLSRGIEYLTEQGIQVCAVAGNHDTRTLPEIARQIESFHLLGPDGTWTSHLVQGDGPSQVCLVGWSFPNRNHRHSPLESTPPPVQDGIVTLGILHGDLDATESNYAPVSGRALRELGYQGWQLGHVHLPGALPTDDSPFYLGSLSPLSHKEQGLHGPVLTRVNLQGEITRQRLSLAPLRWETVELDCTELSDPQDNLTGHILAVVQHLVADISDDLEQVQALGLKVVLTGLVDRPVELARVVSRLDLDDLQIPHDWGTAFVRSIDSQVTGNYDLPELAGQDHPAGLLARHILALRDPNQPVPGLADPILERTRLVAQARRQLIAIDTREAFVGLEPLVGDGLQDQDSLPGEDSLPDEAIAARLVQVAQQALAHLLDSAGGGNAAV